MNEDRRIATDEEEAQEMMIKAIVWPDIDWNAKLKEVKEEGYSTEVCLRCNVCFLATTLFIKCAAEDCPMKGEDKRSLLERIFKDDEE